MGGGFGRKSEASDGGGREDERWRAETRTGSRAPPPAKAQRGAATDVPDRVRVGLAVAGLLLLHYALAAWSLLQENPTIDEVVHLPAGVTYWQKGTFRLYHHNPPLVKLVAALPVVLSGAQTAPIYESSSWKSREPEQATIAHLFARENAARYFELFALARLLMPLFSLIGGLVVFAWSRRLYGNWGGLLSLALWVFCPNVLAHSRLITSDAGSAAIGVLATYVFWTYLKKPTWLLAVASGVLLGLAQLTKFSLLLLYAVWPFLWLVHLAARGPPREWLARVCRGSAHGLTIVAISVLTIDAGYLFEGVGKPLGQYEFGSATLDEARQAGEGSPLQEKPALRDHSAIPRESLSRYLARTISLPVAGALRCRIRRTEDRGRGDTAAVRATASGRRGQGAAACPNRAVRDAWAIRSI